MKFVKLFSLLLLTGSLHAAPLQPSSIRVKMTVPRDHKVSPFLNYIGGGAYPAYLSDMVEPRPDGNVATVTKDIPGLTQIVFLSGYPLLVNDGDNVDIVLSPAAKPGTALVPAVNSKAGSRILLPNQIQNIYAGGYSATVQQSRATVDAFIKSAAGRVEKLIAAAGITDNTNMSLLRTFESVKQLDLKYTFAYAHREVAADADFTDWYNSGFSIADPGFSAISDYGVAGAALTEWWSGKQWKDSSLTDDMQIQEILNNAKSDLLKDSFASSWFRGEAGNYRFTPKLKKMYPLIKAGLVAGSPGMHIVDSVYDYYKKLDAGQPAYNFSLKNTEGNIVHLSDFKGKMVVIDFWGTWCSACIATLPNFKQLEESYKGKDDIVFLHVAYESYYDGAENHWKEFATKRDAAGPRSLVSYAPETKNDDPEYKAVFEGYCLKAFPCILAIDKDGNFLDNRLGYLEEPIVAEKVAAFYKQMH